MQGGHKLLLLLLLLSMNRSDQAWPCFQVLQRTMVCDYEVPDNVKVSWNALDLIRRLLVKDPFQRYTILDIMRHPFFRTDLPPAAAGLNAYCLSQQVSSLLCAGMPDCTASAARLPLQGSY